MEKKATFVLFLALLGKKAAPQGAAAEAIRRSCKPREQSRAMARPNYELKYISTDLPLYIYDYAEANTQ